MAKKEDFNIIERNTKFAKNPQNLIRTLQRNKRDFFLRDTTHMTSLIYDGKEVIFTKKESMFPVNQLWIFNVVRKDALDFANRVEKGEAKFVMPEKYVVNRTNLQYNDSYGSITGTDINAAYWTIAYRLGIISPQTYQRVIGEDTKVVRLAALAILGRDVVYNEYQNGKIMKDKKVVNGSKLLKEFYKAIRYTCYMHMHSLAELLGNDFDAYRTDCIYYRNTDENTRKVYAYLDEHDFYYKQLEYENQNEQHEQ